MPKLYEAQIKFCREKRKNISEWEIIIHKYFPLLTLLKLRFQLFEKNDIAIFYVFHGLRYLLQFILHSISKFVRNHKISDDLVSWVFCSNYEKPRPCEVWIFVVFTKIIPLFTCPTWGGTLLDKYRCSPISSRLLHITCLIYRDVSWEWKIKISRIVRSLNVICGIINRKQKIYFPFVELNELL